MADIKQIQLSGSEFPLDIKDQIARNWIAGAIDLFYPIGSVIINFGVNPSDYLTGTTWVRTAIGKAVVGVDPDNTLMDTAGETFGQANSIVVSHTHTQSSHSHTVNSHSHTVNSHTHSAGSLGGYYRTRGKDNDSTSVHGALSYGYSAYDASGPIVITGNTGASAPGTSASAPGTNSVAPNINSAGVSATNKNYQPSMAFYIWKRTE